LILTVVLPTCNRSDLLGRTLQALLGQSLTSADYEIMVVDDGSTDATPQVVTGLGIPESRLRYLRQDNRGPAAARNLGVSQARGDLILFTGDDCIPDPRLLEEHLRAHHEEGDVGVIGHVAWHPELTITPFMLFLEEGVQFGFHYIKDPEHAPYWAFYTSNCSLRKRRLEDSGGFDEDFRYAAWEDIELAHRLTQGGLRLVYRPTAVTYHHHAATLERYLQRQRLSGRAAVTLWRKHPELAKQLNLPLAAHPEAVRRLYDAAVLYAFSLGVRDALRAPEAPEDSELEALYSDPAMVAAGRAWMRELLGEDLGGLRDLYQELRDLRTEYDRIKSRRFYRWSECAAHLGWRLLKPFTSARPRKPV